MTIRLAEAIVHPIKTFDAKPGFIEDSVDTPDFLSVGSLLRLPESPTHYLIDNLVPKGGNVFIRVASDVDAQMLAIAMGVAVSAGMPFPPYGNTSFSGTVLAFSSGSLKRVREQIVLAIAQCGAKGRERVNSLLHLYHPKLDGKRFEYLNARVEQVAFRESLPNTCGLVIFYDGAGFLATKKERQELDYKKFTSYISELNQKEIAVVVFFQSARKAYEGLEEELLMDTWHNVIDLSYWAGAPTEFGGGFTVTRRKVSEFDPVPISFQYWYTVIDGKLDSGWECHDLRDSAATKRVEMLERQLRVKDLVAQGMQQKEIATLLDVNPATISRDISRIKVKDRAKSASGSFDDEEFA